MPFRLEQSEVAKAQLQALQGDASKGIVFKAAKKALRLLAENPRHQGLNTRKFHTMRGPHGADVFEAYAPNRMQGAWRVFFCYGPGTDTITIIAVTPPP
jgi:hypothetical protein